MTDVCIAYGKGRLTYIAALTGKEGKGFFQPLFPDKLVNGVAKINLK